MPRNTVTEQIGHTTIRNLDIASGPSFFFPRGGHGRRNILMDFHPYSHETSIFTLGAPHEEVQGRQTKLHPGFTMGKQVQLPQASQFFEMPTLFCPTSLNDVLQNFLIGQWTYSCSQLPPALGFFGDLSVNSKSISMKFCKHSFQLFRRLP